MNKKLKTKKKGNDTKEEILNDYRVGWLSRFASLLGRKEVLRGRAKFGIFGDGKEVAQLAMAKTFKKGDWRSGYYRDQTFMFSINACTVKQFFAQLYADANLKREPHSFGRQMNSHFSTPLLDHDGDWLDQTKLCNSSSDLSPTGGQMARLLGLAFASKLYKNSRDLKKWKQSRKFSNNGTEVAFGTIGNASTSEGVFWETINAAGVLQVPMVLSIWDDGYGISVPNEYQTTKGDISELLKGFKSEKDLKGFNLIKVEGHDYEKLVSSYQKAVEETRRSHVPSIVHVIEMTQPQGHSTSGSHERYKSKKRLQFEKDFDCLKRMRSWIEEKDIASKIELDKIEKEAEKTVKNASEEAWNEFISPMDHEREEALKLMLQSVSETNDPSLKKIFDGLSRLEIPLRRTTQSSLQQFLYVLRTYDKSMSEDLRSYLDQYKLKNQDIYSSHLLSGDVSNDSSSKFIRPEYDESCEKIDGRQIIQRFFEQTLGSDPRVFILGEDVGKLGGVNLEFEGLYEKFGESRITDTGIREATILGQGIGCALRGLKPIVDIQYLDYLIYALQGLSDDVATLRYRTGGQQAAPLIVRTKGHRLEGIWHTGSPIGMLLGSVRGMHLCVPRNSVQAAGMYKTLLESKDPAIVIEVLNAYRIKEVCPQNLGSYSLALGEVEILRSGEHVTVVTYGANVKIALEASNVLLGLGIHIEVIDVQTLLPFDYNEDIKKSIIKTNSVVFFDEDVPGGASAFMMQQVLEKQGAYDYLDSPPRTLSAKEHRSAYGSDGDYFSKPNMEDLINIILEIMNERFPENF